MAFTIYQKIKGPGQPGNAWFESVGLTSIWEYPQAVLWPEPQDYSELMPEAHLKSVVAPLAEGVSAYFDIETAECCDANTPSGRANLDQVIQWANEEQPTCEFGFYKLAPYRQWTAALRENNYPSTPSYADWESANIARGGIVENAAMSMPSLYIKHYDEVDAYTGLSDQDNFAAYTAENLAQADLYRAARGISRVIPFISPQHWDQEREDEGDLVDYSYMRTMLNAVYKLGGDGLIIWTSTTGHAQPWDPTDEWWLATLDFIEEVNGDQLLVGPYTTREVGGTTLSCTSTVTTGTVYCSLRTDRQWTAGEAQAIISASTFSAPATAAPEFVAAGQPQGQRYYAGWVVVDDQQATSDVLLSQYTAGTGFEVLSVDGDNIVAHSQVDVEAVCTEAGTVAGTVQYGGVEQVNLVWEDTKVTVPVLDTTGLAGTHDFVVNKPNPAPYGDTTVVVFKIEAGALNLTLVAGTSNIPYDARVLWGDGQESHINAYNAAELSHNYAAAGEYTVEIAGDFPYWLLTGTTAITQLFKVLNWGRTNWTSGLNSFTGAVNLIECDSSTVDTHMVDSMGNMLANWTSISATPCLSGFNTSLVTNMYAMLANWTQVIDPPDLSNFDTSQVRSMGQMMIHWDAMTSPPDLSGFNTSSCTDMANMMAYWGSCLAPPDLSSFDVSKVANMSLMMRGWSLMTDPPDLSGWVTTAATRMEIMMYGWSSMTSAPDLSGFVTNNVTNMANMMLGWTAMGEIDIPIDTWNIEKCTNMANFLSGTTLSTVCYDRVLIAWAAQTLIVGGDIHFGNSKYTAGGAAEAARTTIIGMIAGTITDGGAA